MLRKTQTFLRDRPSTLLALSTLFGAQKVRCKLFSVICSKKKSKEPPNKCPKKSPILTIFFAQGNDPPWFINCKLMTHFDSSQHTLNLLLNLRSFKTSLVIEWWWWMAAKSNQLNGNLQLKSYQDGGGNKLSYYKPSQVRKIPLKTGSLRGYIPSLKKHLMGEVWNY